MSGVRALLVRISSLFREDSVDRLQEEIDAHTEQLAADYEARGISATEARYAARRELGNQTTLRQAYREQSGLPVIENFWLDLKYAFRTLRRNPVFSASCIATQTIGLGAMITVLCVVSAFLWKSLPFPHPESLVVIKETDPRNGLWPFSEPTLLDVEQREKSMSGMAAYRRESLALTGKGEPESIVCAAVTPSFFQVLGLHPLLGTAFSDGTPQVVISRRLWKRKWDENWLAVGSSVNLDGAAYSVAGVAEIPNDLLPGVDVLYPLIPQASDSRSAHEIEVIARLQAGVSQPQAQAELNSIATRIGRENPQTNAGWGMRVMSLHHYLVGPETSRSLWMIFAAVAFLWLLACANVAGLQLARGVTRKHEMSTRLALGAGPGRLLMQTLTESLLLGAGGCILGVILAQLATELIRNFASEAIPQLAHVQLDAFSISVAILCLLASTVLFGLWSGRTPAWQATREIARRDQGRDLLIVVQVALASILLLGATLLFQSFLRLRAVDPGFDPEHVLTARVNLGIPDQDSSRRVAFFDEAEQQLGRLPGIDSVGVSNVLPFSGQGTANRFRTEDQAASEFHSAAWRSVTPGFFKTLGVPLRQGRLFNNSDLAGSQQVVIINEAMAKAFWADQDPVGKRLLWGKSGSLKTIVGVVGDLRDLSVDEPPAPMMFRPFSQLTEVPMILLIRVRPQADGSIPSAAITEVRRTLWSINPAAAIECRSLPELMSASLLRPRASLLAVSAFALIALLTAAFGLYALISYRVNQRQQEIGVRLALGASPSSVRWTVQRRCLNLVSAGLGIGLAMAFGLTQWMASLLYKTKPTEVSAYLAVGLAFAAVAFVASFAPAYRASHLDPSAALRHE